MKLKRVPTKTERWFLDLCTKEQERCSSDKNFAGQMFWYFINKLAYEEFYYTRQRRER